MDSRTADNAQPPHVSVYDTATEDVICTTPIRDSIARAEHVAGINIEALRQHPEAV